MGKACFLNNTARLFFISRSLNDESLSLYYTLLFVLLETVTLVTVPIHSLCVFLSLEFEFPRANRGTLQVVCR